MNSINLINESFFASLVDQLKDPKTTTEQKEVIEKILKDEIEFKRRLGGLINDFIQK
jgi:hypothetical protein